MLMRPFSVICLAVFLLINCRENPEEVREKENSPDPLAFSITGTDENNTFEIDSGEYVNIEYSSDAVNPVITFTHTPDSTDLVLHGSADDTHPMTVYATSAAEGQTFTVTATLTDASDSRTAQAVFKIAVRVFVPPPVATTKNYDNRGGQTLAQIASTYDTSANTVTVSSVDNIGSYTQEYLDNYIRGVDVGSLIEVEQAGGKFYDVDGYQVEDALELLSYYGINWIRIRIWNDPYASDGRPYGGGTNDLPKAIELSRRAKKWGMKVLLDFHYSDFWTHPGQQTMPKAWASISPRNADTVSAKLKEYTKEVLTAMYEAGALPDMVQVGNETLTGIAGFPHTPAADRNKLFSAGLSAVREISAQYDYPIKTMLHATNGMSTISWWFNDVKSLDFDVLGLSFYPFWHGNRTAFQNGLGDLAKTFNKQIVVAEYSVSFTDQAGTPNGQNMYGSSNAEARTYIDTGTDRTISGQAQTIRNFNSDIMRYAVNNSGERLGLGSFWWECAWLPLSGTGWALAGSKEWYDMKLPGYDSSATVPNGNQRVTWANQAFFTFQGTVLPSANAFLLMMGKPPREYTRD